MKIYYRSMWRVFLLSKCMKAVNIVYLYVLASHKLLKTIYIYILAYTARKSLFPLQDRIFLHFISHFDIDIHLKEYLCTAHHTNRI